MNKKTKDEQIYEILKTAKKAAIKYKKLTDKPLGITGEIAEVEAAKIFRHKLCLARQQGYDLIDSKKRKIQVKGRVYQKNHRVPSININKEFDLVLLVLLNENYNPFQIYEAKRQDVIDVLTAPGSKARNERFSMGVGKFVSISELVYVDESENINKVKFKTSTNSKRIIKK